MCRQSATVYLVKLPVLSGCSGLSLAERLVRLPDPRHRRGRRHPFVAVLLIATSAVMAGARSYAPIGQWARSAPQEALSRLGARLLTSFATFPWRARSHRHSSRRRRSIHRPTVASSLSNSLCR
ncbi:transposase family protein [Streptomyces sp. CoH27]|uniref:transposase family protein n=1 Tax=Streptomyces sp. CoH27 TaxID=2875763 RepID=UPI0027DF35DC|nr:transposase family protein [Streptomyces sp. CoH27]